MTDPQESAGPIWAKRVEGQAIDPAAVAYCAGRDVRSRPEADRALLPYDLATNAAHAIMLAETGCISGEEGRALLSALLEVRARTDAGEAILRPEAEDIHMSIELMVTEIAGPGMGGRLHTARSRNDQVATDMALWMRDQAALLGRGIMRLANALARHAKKHAAVPFPGFTHMQPAMISTWGHWSGAYLARVSRDLRATRQFLDSLAECPLGSAASYGTSWPIDRARTAALLGFRRPTRNTMDAIWSRGEAEARFVFLASQHLGHLSGIGQDLILFSSPPRAWLRLADAYVTGSSIMPQKRNPDFAEVTRGKAAVVSGILQALLGIGTAAPGGYNRDTQWTKYLVMDAAEEVLAAPEVFEGVFETLQVDEAAARAGCADGFLMATDLADFLARSRNLPFRDAYRVVGLAVRESDQSTGQVDFDAANRALKEVAPDTEPIARDEFLDDLDTLIRTRNQHGAPHPDRVVESVEALADQVAEDAAAIGMQLDAWQARICQLWELAADRAG